LTDPDEKPPVLTQNEPDLIILHLGASHVEQRASLYNGEDCNISSRYIIKRSVDTTVAGIYGISYSVANSAGLTSENMRQAPVFAPSEAITRKPYSFSGQGEVGADFAYACQAAAAGEMTLTISDIRIVRRNQLAHRLEEGNIRTMHLVSFPLLEDILMFAIIITEETNDGGHKLWMIL